MNRKKPPKSRECELRSISRWSGLFSIRIAYNHSTIFLSLFFMYKYNQCSYCALSTHSEARYTSITRRDIVRTNDEINRICKMKIIICFMAWEESIGKSTCESTTSFFVTFSLLLSLSLLRLSEQNTIFQVVSTLVFELNSINDRHSHCHHKHTSILMFI